MKEQEKIVLYMELYIVKNNVVTFDNVVTVKTTIKNHLRCSKHFLSSVHGDEKFSAVHLAYLTSYSLNRVIFSGTQICQSDLVGNDTESAIFMYAT